VTEPSVLHDTRAAYDAVATLYAELFSNVLETLPMERALLAAFAELVQVHNAGPVADIGCGPGHVTAHVHALGPTTFGIDLSSEMVALARRAHPDLRFDEGSMTALDLADGDHRVALAYRWSPDSLAELLRQAGFVEVARLRREPHDGERFQQAHLLVRKPQES
jgi:SAM-dependent methyltransferase